MMPPSSNAYTANPAVRTYLAYEAAGVTIEQEGLTIIRFGEFLVEKGIIDRHQLLQALMVHHLRGGRLGQAVARLGYCDAARLEALAGEYHGMTPIDL